MSTWVYPFSIDCKKKFFSDGIVLSSKPVAIASAANKQWNYKCLSKQNAAKFKSKICDYPIALTLFIIWYRLH